MNLHEITVFIFLAIATICQNVAGHGRLISPAQRSSAFRYGFNNPPNYNDNELYCGGAGIQWGVNNGGCGVCGDPYDAAVKPNEDVDGLYVKNGIITGIYPKGSVLAATVQLTAYHMGWFEFRLCPLATTQTKVTEECLNKTVLRTADTGETRIMLKPLNIGAGMYEIRLQLPADMTCDRCVLQWWYNTGNSWGCEASGCCVGCGKQETFKNCADISILGSQITDIYSSPTDSVSPTTTTTTKIQTTKPTTTWTTMTNINHTLLPCQNDINLNCGPSATYMSLGAAMTDWCCWNCATGFCPRTHCVCIED